MYEKIFRNILFPLYEGPIRRRNTHRYLREYEKSQWLTPEALEDLRLTKLNSLLAHCWSNVPFLKHYWTEAGLDSRPLQRTSEIARYPVITKQIITENYDGMRASTFDGVVLKKTTGGSTGDPFKFEYSQESYARRTAIMWRGYRWCGSDLGRRTAYVWGMPEPKPGFAALKDRCYHAAFNRIMLDAFSMSEDKHADYVARMQKFRPDVVVGYVAPLLILSRWMLETGVRISPPAAVISGAEALARPDRETIATAFGAPVFNTYGCREFMLIGSECEHRDGMHTSADHLIVETVSKEGQPMIGESGDVCITDLHNYAMPFVRYLNGDRATSAERKCRCGRGLPLLESIDGRILDTIVTPSGRVLPGEFFVYVMLNFPEIAQYQVVQTAASRIEIRIVSRAGTPFNRHDAIAEKIAEKVAEDVEFVICEVPEIPPTASGKRRITVSNIQ